MPVDDESRSARLSDLYDAYAVDVLAYAARRTSDPEDAADVLADTFMVAWRRIDLVPAGSQARPWLFGVARRCLANQRRGHRRVARLRSRLRAEIAATVRAGAVEAEVDDRVADAFNRLSATDRELLTLVIWDGLDRAEVATAMGWSRRRVRVRLHRARQRLLRHLDSGHDGETTVGSRAHLEELG